MATGVLSGSRAGTGSAVSTAIGSGTFQIAGVGTVQTPVVHISLGGSLRASSQAAAALTLTLPPPLSLAYVISASRPGAGSTVATPPRVGSLWDAGASIWDGGSSPWDRTTAIAYHVPGIGILARPLPGVPQVTLVATITATSQARVGALGLHIALAGQIGASSRASARLPSTISLAGRITAQAKAQLVTASTRPVMQGAIRGTSSGRAVAVITAPSGHPRQTEISIIT
jgi:hypothetical protein